MTRPTFTIAIDLLEDESQRLLNDHYETAPDPAEAARYAPCDGCERARTVRLEIDSLVELNKRLVAREARR
jgi:hypothetical protein